MELVASSIIDGDLNLLHDKQDCGDFLVLVLKVGFAKQVVQVVVEAVVGLVDNENLLNLLDDLLLAAVVDYLQVLLLDLDNLLLLVEIVEAVDEAEVVAFAVAIAAVAVVITLVAIIIVALAIRGESLRGVDRLCRCVELAYNLKYVSHPQRGYGW